MKKKLSVIALIMAVVICLSSGCSLPVDMTEEEQLALELVVVYFMYVAESTLNDETEIVSIEDCIFNNDDEWYMTVDGELVEGGSHVADDELGSYGPWTTYN